MLKIQGNKLENCRIFGSFDKEGFLVLDDKVSVNKTKHNSNNSHYQIHNNKLIKQNINLPKTINIENQSFEEEQNSFSNIDFGHPNKTNLGLSANNKYSHTPKYIL